MATTNYDAVVPPAQPTKTKHPNEESETQTRKRVRFASSPTEFSAAASALTPSIPNNPTTPPAPLTRSQISTLKRRIHRLESAKLRIRFFMKILLLFVLGTVGNNIFGIISRQLRMHYSGSLALGFIPPIERFAGKSPWSPWVSLFGTTDKGEVAEFSVPRETLQPFGAYPNILNITPEMREEFHPVVIFPLRNMNANTCKGKNDESAKIARKFWRTQTDNTIRNGESCSASSGDPKMLNAKYDYIIKDHTGKNPDTNESSIMLEGGEKVPQLLPTRQKALEYAKTQKLSKGFDVGRFDEDRRGMYTSSLFLNGSETDHDENTEKWRTVHVGLDIGGPVGTKVYAFSDGVIHSAGYNPDVGDYGHVIVVEHHLSSSGKTSDGDIKPSSKIYALYGHLDAKSTLGKYPGQKVRKGQVLGRMGNTADNGGWTGTHVHFQLAVHPPEKEHDMPGAVTMADRKTALLEYIDPRYVVGEVY
ncbi:hypothetical protein ACHAXS_013811 [Conticribra weissflogii]